MRCLLSVLLLNCMALAAFGQVKYDTVTITGMPSPLVLAYVPAGKFLMGTAGGDANTNGNEGPQIEVELPGFFMSAFEIRWEQYDCFFRDAALSVNQDVDAITRPSTPYLDFTLGMGKTGYPANSMQQYGALMFCRWLYQKTGVFYRLPTEAEWEYACRAGTTATYPWGNDTAEMKENAWYAGNSQGKYQPVGSLKPNAWGLYDMLGNVAEWVLDGWDENYFKRFRNGVREPLVMPEKRHPRPVRGGSYRDEAAKVRPAFRMPSDPVWNRRDPQVPKSKWWNADAPFVGFRVVRPAIQPSAGEVAAFFEKFLFK